MKNRQQKNLEQVTKSCEQLVNAFMELKVAIDQLSESYNKLGELADIRERRFNYDETKKLVQ